MRRIWLGFWVVAVTVAILLGSLDQPPEYFLWPWSWAAWAPIGYLILVRRPGNRVGLAAYLVGLSWAVVFGGAWVVVRLSSSNLAAWVETLLSPFGVIPWLMIVWLFVVFPTGRYEGRSELVLGRIAIWTAALVNIGFLLSTQPLELTGVPSPLGVSLLDRLTDPIVSDSAFLVVVVLLVVSLALLVRRARRADGIERQQYRWLLLGGSIFAIVLLVGNFAPEDSGPQSIFLLAGWAIPICIGIAVIRYRLYEIDRILSRTLGYALVVMMLGLVYVSGAVWLPSRVAGDDVPPLFVAASTLAVVALFNPVRRRVLGWVDRRFYRSRYDSERILVEFSARMRDQVDLDRLTGDLKAVVDETLRPTSATVWLRR